MTVQVFDVQETSDRTTLMTIVSAALAKREITVPITIMEQLDELTAKRRPPNTYPVEFHLEMIDLYDSDNKFALGTVIIDNVSYSARLKYEGARLQLVMIGSELPPSP